MRPHLFLLTGFPGTGKLTVARALEASLLSRGETVRLVDNHSINNPIFRLIENDGLTQLPARVWDRVGEVAHAVVATVEELTPPSWHVIFTAYLDGATDRGWLPRLEQVAHSRRSALVFVRLLCNPAENVKRIGSPERRTLMKSVDPAEPIRLAAAGPPYDPHHPAQLDLDVTDLAPNAAADLIVEHALALESQNP